MASHSDLPVCTDIASVFLENRPLMDLRAPVEFEQGAFPGAENWPLLTDEERRQVGICYKEAGQDAAIVLGYELIDVEEKARRVAQWQAFAEAHPQGLLYCFRGGLRSRLTQRMLFEATGIAYPRIAGGYKAMRRFLLEVLQTQSANAPLIMLGGRTGVGKTPFLFRFERHLDLEGRARHKGSAFGRHPEPQPLPINFENQIAIDLLRLLQRASDDPILVEDEGKMIGARQVPPVLFERMNRAPLVVIERPLDERVEQSLKDYVIDLKTNYGRVSGTDAAGATGRVRDHILAAIDRVSKRLGGVRHAQMRGLAEEAFAAWHERDDVQGLRDLIRQILVEYYDPMYDYQLANKCERIVFSGPPEAVAEELAARGLRPAPPN